MITANSAPPPPSQGLLNAVSQEPARISENFRRILEGIQPGSQGSASPSPPTQMISELTPPVSLTRQARLDAPRSAPQPPTAASFIATPDAGAGVVTACHSDWGGEFVTSSGKGIDLEGLFPFLFSFCGFLIFLDPVWLMVHLSHDPNIMYWVGHWCELALLLPLPFFAAFFIQARMGRPHKTTVLLSLLAPAVALLVLGDILTTVSSNRADQLRSTDCDTFAEKRALERSWQAAHRLYMNCLEETVPTHNLTLEAALALFRIQDCEEFSSGYAKYEQDWDYLWWLEEQHQCAGWCTTSVPLWTMQPVSDSCSVVASQLFSGKVKRMSKQVVVYSIFILVGTSIGHLVAGPSIRAMGLDW